MKMILLCLLNAAMLAFGQVLFKLGSNGKDMDSLINIAKVIFNPIIIIALTLYALTTVLWLYILSKMPISTAYPIQMLAIPIVLIASIFLFKESISLTRWIGISLICIGVYVSFSR